ncbi:CpsD/CapB family tyrosine-protein kinase [Vibrio sp. SM6]|uniref:CpsD/CapB family tyrosine-protein kinase n=1 Tax=Vibrio agarilyticus TaxID=2726741 RepID=A0A7X8TRJ9_9VIBR|nr:CpsD/CapB family tyrosine-protein kinase [Vibrio agarilyticus]NLS12913.1 CpsD/CapB family tyrosine-protein kinase [Vibrio agarilyticus]
MNPLMIEVERIYYQLVRNNYRSIAITASQPKEGVTSLACLLAERSLLAGKRTLLVDFNLSQPSFIAQNINLTDTTAPQNSTGSNDALNPSQHAASNPILAESALSGPELVAASHNNAMFTGIVAPSRRETIVELRRPNALERYIKRWKESFDLIIFDTAAVAALHSESISPERVASACDGTLLVVLSGKTTQNQVKEAIKKISDAHGTLVGCVMNDQFDPSLKSELLREIERLAKRFPKIAQKLTSLIKRSQLLSLER